MSVETGHRIQHRQSLSSQTPASESRQKTFHGSSKKGYTGVNGREDNRATGIGLYLSRKILKKLGHEITVDSQVDKGTEVRLSLWKKELDMY